MVGVAVTTVVVMVTAVEVLTVLSETSLAVTTALWVLQDMTDELAGTTV